MRSILIRPDKEGACLSRRLLLGRRSIQLVSLSFAGVAAVGDGKRLGSDIASSFSILNVDMSTLWEVGDRGSVN